LPWLSPEWIEMVKITAMDAGRDAGTGETVVILKK
jgi:hypothetical protein